MNATLTFFFGLFVLLLFAWYFLTDKEQTQRWLGTTLALLLCAFCVDAFLPFEKKIHLGLDLQGGTSFLVRLVPPVPEDGGKPRAITPEMQEQAVEAIRKRVDEFGVSEPPLLRAIGPVRDQRELVRRASDRLLQEFVVVLVDPKTALAHPDGVGDGIEADSTHGFLPCTRPLGHLVN